MTGVATLLLAALAVGIAAGQWITSHRGTKATEQQSKTSAQQTQLQQETVIIQRLQALAEAASLAVELREKENIELKQKLAAMESDISKRDKTISRLANEMSELKQRIAELERSA